MPIPKDNTKLEKAKPLRREMTPHERKLRYASKQTRLSGRDDHDQL